MGGDLGRLHELHRYIGYICMGCSAAKNRQRVTTHEEKGQSPTRHTRRAKGMIPLQNRYIATMPVKPGIFEVEVATEVATFFAKSKG